MWCCAISSAVRIWERALVWFGVAALAVALVALGLTTYQARQKAQVCDPLVAQHSTVQNAEVDSLSIIDTIAGNHDPEWVALNSERRDLEQQMRAEGCEFDSYYPASV